MVCALEPHCPFENHSTKLALTHISNEELTPSQDLCSGADSHGPARDARRGSFEHQQSPQCNLSSKAPSILQSYIEGC